MEKILGIDLGTTNTVCAMIEGGDPEIILNSERDATTPSVVGFRNGNERVVGEVALNQAIENPQKTIHSVKRYMGRSDYTFDLGFDEFTPEEISGMILRKVRADAEEYLNHSIEKAVITVPAYFGDKQRQATKRAGEIAGLEVERIINEPTAAAIAYGMDTDQNQNILVADLGGGTFDVSILDLGEGICDVIATDGIRHLGGDDWDKAVVEHLAEDFQKKHSVNLRDQPEARERLRQNAEEAKINLTTQHQTVINIPFITSTEEGPLHLKKTLKRDTFDQITTDLRKELSDPIEDALTEANLRKREIANVILVGGSTRMPQIKRQIQSILGTDPKSELNPDEVVAMGAAIQGSILSGEQENVVLLDVTPKSVGIEVKGGIFEPIITKNTTIPTRQKKMYTTSKDNQETVEINVYQGENQIAKQNEKLGDFVLRDIPKAEAGTPRITVEFKIDADGIVIVNAKETSTNVEKELRIDRQNDITETEVNEMKERARGYEEASKSQKEQINARKEADDTVGHARRILLDEDKELTPTAAIKIENRIEKVNEVLEDDSSTTEDVKRATRSLENIVGKTEDGKDGDDNVSAVQRR